MTASKNWAKIGFLVVICAAYTLIYVFFPLLFNGIIAFNIAQTFTWLLLAGLAFFLWRSTLQKPRFKRSVVFLGLGLGLSQVSILVLSGLVCGFGRSPFDHTLYGILINILMLAAALVGMEMTRATLLTWFHRKPVLGVILISLLMLAFQEPYYKFASLSTAQGAMELVGSELLPNFALNVLASVLALLSGPLPAIVYRGILLIFEWGSPILPNTNWAITGLIGSLVPMIGLIYIQKTRFADKHPAEASLPAKQTSFTAWIIVLAVAVFAIWFNMGVFGVRPFIVSGHSMNPAFDVGDLVILKTIQPADVQVGDVIRYDRDFISVVHRVIEIQTSPNGLVFLTKGDNNNVVDPPVPQEYLRGKIVGIVPEVGWVSIGIRQVFGWGQP